MNGFAAVVTHHKTGTVWMQATFRQIATKLGIRFVRVHTDDIVPAEELAAPIIFFERSGKFREYPGLFGDPRLKILHLIRDPRDVVISGMHYHRTSREEWLHQPSDRFEGRTYQSEINGLATDRARYVFEMNNRAASAIRTMLRWYDGDRSNAVECKYEDLIQDVDMVVFTRAATHLGFSGQELEVCRKAFWRNSLFGRKAGRNDEKGHIRSGKARQWMDIFDRPLAEEFARRFKDALVRLGYESDRSWIDRLPALSPGLDNLQ
jgi:hypothetical protein